MTAGQPCFNCGYYPKRGADARVFEDGELAEVGSIAPAYTAAERNAWHAMLEAIRLERNYKPGWERHKYREKFNTWPPAWGSPEPIDPTPEVRSWVRSRQIAYAKSKNRLTAPPVSKQPDNSAPDYSLAHPEIADELRKIDAAEAKARAA
jgi:hypothetical protein